MAVMRTLPITVRKEGINYTKLILRPVISKSQLLPPIYHREQNDIFCTPKGAKDGYGEQNASVCSPKGAKDFRGEWNDLVCTPMAEKLTAVSRTACLTHRWP